MRRGDESFVKEYLSRLSRQVIEYPLGRFSEPQALAAWRAMIWAAHKGDDETRAEAIRALVACVSFIRGGDVPSAVLSSEEAAKAFAWGFFDEERDYLRGEVSRMDIEHPEFALEAARAVVEQSEKRRRRRSVAILHWIARQDSLFAGADDERAKELMNLIIRLLPHGVDPADLRKLTTRIFADGFPVKARLRLQRGMVDVSRRWGKDSEGTAAVCQLIERLLPETRVRLEEARLRWLATLPDQEWGEIYLGDTQDEPGDGSDVHKSGSCERKHSNQGIREIAHEELRARGLL